MKKQPRISVIMSVYNGSKYLNESVESILKQTFVDFEFLIIDDCSLDDSLETLKLFASKDSRIKLYTNTENLGLTKNLNKLIKVAEGEFIARMDADDISENNRFQRQIDYFNNHADIDILGTYSSDIDENGKVFRKRTTPLVHEDIIKILPMLCPMTHPSIMFKKNSFEKIGFYNDKYLTSQDLDMYFRAVGSGLKFANIPEYLFKYRMDSEFLKRKNLKFRLNDYKLRIEGFKHMKLPWYKYGYALVPLILGILPSSFYNTLKKIDPR